jgi:hypothetical protein
MTAKSKSMSNFHVWSFYKVEKSFWQVFIKYFKWKLKFLSTLNKCLEKKHILKFQFVWYNVSCLEKKKGEIFIQIFKVKAKIYTVVCYILNMKIIFLIEHKGVPEVINEFKTKDLK